jgi:hypothetical protein
VLGQERQPAIESLFIAKLKSGELLDHRKENDLTSVFNLHAMTKIRKTVRKHGSHNTPDGGLKETTKLVQGCRVLRSQAPDE